jgi:Thrombospondin type 3 repeat
LLRELRIPDWWPAATLAVFAAAAAGVIAAVMAWGGGGGEDQVAELSPSSVATEARPATASSTAPAACPSGPTQTAEEPTLFDTLGEGAVTDDPDFEADFEVEAAADAAQTNADLSLEMRVREGNVAPAGFYIVLPADWGITPGCQIPIGLAVGSLRWDAYVGLDGGPCSQPAPLQFTMLNATTDTSDTVSFLDADGNGTPDFAEDKDRTGRRDVVEKYPDFLKRIFPGRTPIRRSAGVFTYTDPPVLAQTLLFSSLDERDGTAMVVLLQNIGDPDALPGDAGFTDYCTPSGFRLTEFGEAQDGSAFYTNPEGGDYVFILTAFGERDADGDGVENPLDTCPFDANLGNPRLRGEGDADEDGMDAACDPSDFEDKPDEDGDGYLNRGDQCPLTPGEDPSTQEDSDDDEIGDECDTSVNGPAIADGDVPFVVRAVEVTVR